MFNAIGIRGACPPLAVANPQDTVDDTCPPILENHVKANDLLDRYPDIAELLRRQSFSYPVNTKADFIEQMVAVSDKVVFRGVPYDTRFGAGLLPDFFFPLASEEDLVTKVAELLISRGLVPLG